MCGPRGVLCAGVVFRGGAGEGPPPALGFDAIADVDRMFRGFRGSGIDDTDVAGVLGTGVESGFSDLVEELPLLCDGGGLEPGLGVDGGFGVDGASF